MATATASHPAQQKDRGSPAIRSERASAAVTGKPQWKHVNASALAVTCAP